MIKATAIVQMDGDPVEPEVEAFANKLGATICEAVELQDFLLDKYGDGAIYNLWDILLAWTASSFTARGHLDDEARAVIVQRFAEALQNQNDGQTAYEQQKTFKQEGRKPS